MLLVHVKSSGGFSLPSHGVGVPRGAARCARSTRYMITGTDHGTLWIILQLPHTSCTRTRHMTSTESHTKHNFNCHITAQSTTNTSHKTPLPLNRHLKPTPRYHERQVSPKIRAARTSPPNLAHNNLSSHFDATYHSVQLNHFPYITVYSCVSRNVAEHGYKRSH